MPLSNWTTAFRFFLGSHSRDGTARKGCGFASSSLKVLLLPVCLITASRTLREIKKLIIKLGRPVISCHIQRKAFGDTVSGARASSLLLNCCVALGKFAFFSEHQCP